MVQRRQLRLRPPRDCGHGGMEGALPGPLRRLRVGPARGACGGVHAASAINLQGACAGPAADAGMSRCARWPACGASSGCCRRGATAGGATVTATVTERRRPAAARGPARGCATPGGPGHGARSGGGPPGPELEPRRPGPGRRLGVELSGRWHARSGPGPSESHLLVSGSLALRLAVTGRSGRIYYRPKSRTMGATRQLQVGRLRSISQILAQLSVGKKSRSVTAATSSCECNLLLTSVASRA
jgi:hypothetical protein